jgi:hypothetical protein
MRRLLNHRRAINLPGKIRRMLALSHEALEEIGSNEYFNFTKFPKILFSTHRTTHHHKHYLPYNQHVLW